MLPGVKNAEVKDILRCVENALGIFQQHEGALTVGEIRTRSLLMVVRAELEEHLRRAQLLTGPESKRD